MRRLLTLLAALCLLQAASVPPAAAHRQPLTETTVELGKGAAGSVLQITHRLHVHDAQKVLALMPDVLDADIERAENQARLMAYVADRFALSGNAATTMIGVEIDGDYVFVYQEHPAPAAIEASSLLADLTEAWVNTVYVKDAAGDTVRTVTFDATRPRAEGQAGP